MFKYFSWQWILGKLVEWAAQNLTQEMIDEWLDDLKKLAIPWVRERWDELIEKLREKAADTSTPLDDIVVDALEKVGNALLPDNPEVL